ncbi:MAG: class II aldolase/adducin family protein [Coriobacteriales bacterium]|jgi:L-fuculose-phosphate aldolase|nr:class II aldolase/adducin family protein [Coriobacteriales bacterium]
MPDFNFDQFKRDMKDGFNAAANGLASAAGQASNAVQDAARDAKIKSVNTRDFLRFARDLERSGMVTSHGGNLSICNGPNIWITRTGAMLGHLTPNDISRVNWAESVELDSNASMELKVHRAMYHAAAEKLGQGEEFGSKAIIHAHSLYTTFRSLVSESLVPMDSEGVLLLGSEVPVFSPTETVASDEVATMMAQLVREGGRIAIIRGHGPFAIGNTLEEAYRLTSTLEHSAKLLTLFEQTGRKPE